LVVMLLPGVLGGYVLCTDLSSSYFFCACYLVCYLFVFTLLCPIYTVVFFEVSLRSYGREGAGRVGHSVWER
jgi:hypothetical protein